MRADPTHDEGRPGERAPLSVNDGDALSISKIDKKSEQKRRSRLRRDLFRLADRLEPLDAPAAALARSFAEAA